MNTEEIKETIHKNRKDGRVVFSGITGIYSASVDEFVRQPVDGILYDLNRSEEVCLVWLERCGEEEIPMSPLHWVNDYAVATVIRELKRQIDVRNELLEKSLSQMSRPDKDLLDEIFMVLNPESR